ncbi:MAG: HAD-IA family hydrolase, partial [Solirubrobacterales bacterium]|nr:HAD-IA family hydrolase [Solirubrobacterales bacterium]
MASAHGIRAVLLDAMGTLVELERPWPLLVAQLAHRGVAVDEATARRALRAEIAFYRAEHHVARDRAALSGLRDRCTTVLHDALGPVAAGLPHAEVRGALLAALRFRPFAEVPGVLGELRAAGLAVVVVSNWDVSLYEVLTQTGLDLLVDGAVTSAEHGVAKPDPSIFAAGLALAGAAPDEALHVGDSLPDDV